jgi:adenylate kinase
MKRYGSILIFGPPGAGKGTLGKMLAGAGTVFHLSSGDMFRGMAWESEMGQLVHKYTSRGNLMPDDVAIDVWHRYVEGLIITNRYFPETQVLLLDGIPRTFKQAEVLRNYIDVKQVILLEIEDQEVLIQRLLKRATLERRVDDREGEVLRTRMEIYQRDTLQVLKAYPEELISRFNADQRPLEVLRDILDKLCPLFC